MFTTGQIYDNLSRLIFESGKSARQVEEAAGVARGTIGNIQKGSMPSVDKIAKLANYFSCSIESIIGVQTPPEPIALRASENEWLRILNHMNDDSLLKLRDYTRYLLWLQSQAAEDSLKSQK